MEDKSKIPKIKKNDLKIYNSKELKKRKKKFLKILENMPKNDLNIANSLIDNICFMEFSLEKLMDIIAEKGFTEDWQNGEKQQGIRESPEVKTYNAMIKNYISALGKLADLVPKNESVQVRDELMEFTKR